MEQKENSVKQTAYSIQSNIINRQDHNGGNGIGVAHEVCGTLTKMDRHGVATIVFDPTQITSPTNGSNPQENDPSHTMGKGTHAPVFIIKDNPCYPINTMTVQGRPSDNGRMGMGIGEDGAPQNTITKNHPHAVCYRNGMNILIRRLTPTECLRLQGFPYGYCDIPGATDSKIYQVAGNSMTTHVMNWIGTRIQLVDDVLKEIKSKK